MSKRRLRSAVVPTVMFLAGLGVGGYAMHTKTLLDAYVESTAMILHEEMTTFEYLEDGRGDVVQQLTRIGFNGLFCQGTYLASLPFVRVSDSAADILARADDFRRDVLDEYETYDQPELNCELQRARGGNDV